MHSIIHVHDTLLIITSARSLMAPGMFLQVLIFSKSVVWKLSLPTSIGVDFIFLIIAVPYLSGMNVAILPVSQRVSITQLGGIKFVLCSLLIIVVEIRGCWSEVASAAVLQTPYIHTYTHTQIILGKPPSGVVGEF